MNKRNLVLYIAMSLDGYIAGPDDDISWLSAVESPGEDYGYAEFTKTVDTVIMGRKTYDKVLSFGIPFPHADKDCYVISRSRTGRDENVKFYNGAVEDLIAEIRKKDGKDIYCDGGAELVFELMKKNLIDRYIISIIPVFVGSGTRLFKDGRAMKNLSLADTKTYPFGLVQLHYIPKN
jgi:dihydrofolate reductase